MKKKTTRSANYKIKVGYQYESPYTGYSHHDSIEVTVKAASLNVACKRAEKAARKHGGSAGCMEFVTNTDLISLTPIK